MAKKDGFKVSKKNFPGLKRVTIEAGLRSWEYKNKFYSSLRELDMSVNPQKYTQVKFTPAEQKVDATEDLTHENITAKVETESER